MIDLNFVYRYQGQTYAREIKSMYAAPSLGERVHIRHGGQIVVYAVHSVDWIFNESGPVVVTVVLS